MTSMFDGAAASDASGIDVSKLSSSDKQELQRFIQQESQKAQVQGSIHELTSVCFKKCVTGKITQSGLDKYEEPCVSQCVNRFLDANTTIIKKLEKMQATTMG